MKLLMVKLCESDVYSVASHVVCGVAKESGSFICMPDGRPVNRFGYSSEERPAAVPAISKVGVTGIVLRSTATVLHSSKPNAL